MGVIAQQSTSRSLTSKLIKAIMSGVDKDVKVFMDELKERSHTQSHQATPSHTKPHPKNF